MDQKNTGEFSENSCIIVVFRVVRPGPCEFQYVAGGGLQTDNLFCLLGKQKKPSGGLSLEEAILHVYLYTLDYLMNDFRVDKIFCMEEFIQNRFSC